MLKRMGLFVVATATAVATLILGPQSAVWASTGGSCTAPVVKYPRESMAAFSGHNVEVNGKVCLRYYGPGRIQFTRTPTVSFPTRYPGGGILETLSVATAPFVVASSSTHVAYRFVVRQKVAKVLGGSNFTFEVSYKDGGHYLCMTTGTGKCTGYYGW